MEATIGSHRFRWRMALAALAVVLTSAGVVLVAPAPASAAIRCGTTVNAFLEGYVRGSLETMGCNNNGTFQGRLKDTRADNRGVFLFLCATGRGCTEHYVGGLGNTIDVSRYAPDGLTFWMRWGGSETDATQVTGY